MQPDPKTATDNEKHEQCGKLHDLALHLGSQKGLQQNLKCYLYFLSLM